MSSYTGHISVSDDIMVCRTAIANATPNHNRLSIESVMFSYTTVLKPSFSSVSKLVCDHYENLSRTFDSSDK